MAFFFFFALAASRRSTPSSDEMDAAEKKNRRSIESRAPLASPARINHHISVRRASDRSGVRLLEPPHGDVVIDTRGGARVGRATRSTDDSFSQQHPFHQKTASSGETPRARRKKKGRATPPLDAGGASRRGKNVRPRSDERSVFAPTSARSSIGRRILSSRRWFFFRARSFVALYLMYCASHLNPSP